MNLADDIVSVGQAITAPKSVKFDVKCNLEVHGNLTVKGMSSLTEVTEILDANKRLQERMDEIEKRIDMLWYAPGMPGYEMSKSHYTE